MSGRYPSSPEEAEEARKLVARYDVPADAAWIAQRVYRFLAAHYFVPDMAEATAETLATDWIRELNGYPDWAIEDALQWWISRANKKRAKKPVPGDISERAQFAAAMMIAAKRQLEFYDQYKDRPPAFLR